MFISTPKLGDKAVKVLLSFFSESNIERRQILATDGKLSEEQKRTEEERGRKEMLERLKVDCQYARAPVQEQRMCNYVIR